MENKKVKKIFIGIFAVVGVLLGLKFFWLDLPAVAFVEHLAQYDIFVDHHHQPPTPRLSINHSTGQKGSYFLITGTNYPVFNTAIITINDELIGTIPLDSNGATQFQLSTNSADNGVYFVTVKAAVDTPANNTQTNIEPTAETVFSISPQAPIHPSSGQIDVYTIPEGIGSFYYTYMPILFSEK